jgi:hypothetical protein
MEIIAPPGFAPAPQLVPDTRPSADAAALARDDTPYTPLPVPPTPTQQALVGQAALGAAGPAPAGNSHAAGTAVERRLKPYGVAMLPARGEDPAP